MAKNNKDKKKARKERIALLREKAQQVEEKLRDTVEEEVEYVLSDEEKQEPVKEAASTAAPAAAPNAEVDDDVVRLPAQDLPSKADTGRSLKRKRNKMSWEELKLEITKAYGPEAAELVSEHDGNAEDPFFTVEMKMIPRSVPVPHHWSRLRAFLSNQADREEASGIIPAEIAALGVDKLRASKDKKANPNQMAFVTCFLTGTPLKRKTFGVPMTEFGEVFYENKWIPHARYTPGEHSQRLRQALGLENGSSAPPPWLYSMQKMRRLPPAYPDLRIAGMNAPIPPGTQWGLGQWGEPPRASNNSFLFPGVMGETTSTVSRPTFWGAVPELRQGGAAPAAPTTAAPPVAPAAKKQAAPVPTPPVAPAVVVNPEPFIPASYRPNTHAAPIAPREYSKVQDTGSGTVAGHKMVPEPPGKSK